MLQEDFACSCSEEPARKTVTDSRQHRRQRTYAEHDPVCLRVAEGRKAVSTDAVSEIPPRRERSAIAQAHAPDDARLYCGEFVIRFFSQRRKESKDAKKK